MKTGDCKHFNGMQHDECSAGVNYEELGGTEPGIALRMPCYRLKRRATISCDSFEAITKKEYDAWMKDMDLRVANALVARASIGSHYSKTGNHEDKIKCPVCSSGMITYSISKFNGHVHAQCSTEDCIKFME